MQIILGLLLEDFVKEKKARYYGMKAWGTSTAVANACSK